MCCILRPACLRVAAILDEHGPGLILADPDAELLEGVAELWHVDEPRWAVLAHLPGALALLAQLPAAAVVQQQQQQQQQPVTTCDSQSILHPHSGCCTQAAASQLAVTLCAALAALGTDCKCIHALAPSRNCPRLLHKHSDSGPVRLASLQPEVPVDETRAKNGTHTPHPDWPPLPAHSLDQEHTLVLVEVGQRTQRRPHERLQVCKGHCSQGCSEGG